jgi:predicted nucleotidyltransferase
MDIQLSQKHQIILDTFLNACQADERIVAAFLVGSYVKGKPDQYSDLDLFLVIADESYDDFALRRDSFIYLIGEPLFMEDFDLPQIVFLIFPDGSEVELSYVRESQISQIFNEPFQILLDKKDLTTGIIHHEREVDLQEQREKLRRLIYWFWHDFSHFVTALGRNRLWWAQGQLEVLRSMCIGLARLQNDFSDTDLENEVYFKIDKAMPIASLSPLQDTFCPMEKVAALKAGHLLLRFYEDHAKSLAQEYHILYPETLQQVITERLKELP